MKRFTVSIDAVLWGVVVILVVICAVALSGCRSAFRCRCESVSGEACTASAECGEERTVSGPPVRDGSKSEAPKRFTPTP